MFFTTDEGHPFRHNPLSAVVTPRPIAWISTRDSDGSVNLAPYSFFNLVAYTPPQVMFASTLTKPDRDRSKDTVSNIEASGVFCINIAGYADREAVNLTSASAPRGTDEFELSGVAKADCVTIDCPRVATAPASLECVLDRIIDLEGANNHLVLGRVQAVHLRDDCIEGDRFNLEAYQPLTRLGYLDYGCIRETFEMKRPK